MQNNIVKLLVAAVVSSALLIACKKDDNTVPLSPKEKKLTVAKWKIKDITIPKKNQANTDSSIFKPCMSDDVIVFNTAGFDFQDGANKCDSSIFRYAKGTWIYKDATDSLQLHATAPGKYMSWKVVTLNDSLLMINYTDSLTPANKVTKKLSFKH